MPQKTTKKKLATESLITARHTQVLHDKKWKKFMRYARLFRHIPFIEFVLGAGSMAIGNVSQDSDFDVIIGARSGRIFLARFFSILFFGLLGWRRKKMDHEENATDKICLNHFVTEKSYLLSPPYNQSWQNLYYNLIPIFGDAEKIAFFFKKNEGWAPSRKGRFLDMRYQQKNPSIFKSILEKALGGFAGNALERAVKYIQIARISQSQKAELGYKPRIKYDDLELEFHPDRKKFEKHD